MQFTIHCPCGAQLRVRAADAGGRMSCRCGRANDVPSLSELRRQAGRQRYDVGIAEKLRSMFAEGKLPLDDLCARCGVPTKDLLDCAVICERPYVKGRGYWGTVLLSVISPLWALVALHDDYDNPEILGRELIVHTPLPVCAACARSTRKNKRALRKLLRRASLYEQLLQEYPKAEVTVSP